ncbi:type II toxin-antitoxin system RelE/ParE family toxin [uncultured Brevundimonas sp.]|uniref:type II toxin-antitoxin system RelE/ParE family toxin n=1 Tax=uncultured Brevundimonas sp. TaxID=213418 RepID=UPI0025EEC529|nr:type II toxin-antitoxin system RelE/ParE family toxin [uncultured Brevundimonas sp.]
MKIEFADKRLALIRTDRAHELGLPFAVIKVARQKLVFLEAAPDERTIRNWKSLNYKKLEGFSDGRRQIRINEQYRIVFLVEETHPPVLQIIEIGDTH